MLMWIEFHRLGSALEKDLSLRNLEPVRNRQKKFTIIRSAGLILHGGNEGDCLRVPWSLPWCPRNDPVQICNFIKGCPLPRKKCLGVLAFSKTKHTGLDRSSTLPG